MSSQRRIVSSRANGAKSLGPITPAGIQASSQNALKHGLLAQCVVLQGESQECFSGHCSALIHRFQPADDVELGLIEEMAASSWRMRRAWAIETRLLDNHSADQPPGDQLDRIAAAFADPSNLPPQALIQRYETRLHMMYQRAFHNLLLLRTAVPPNEPSPISEHLLPPPDPLPPAAPVPATPAGELQPAQGFSPAPQSQPALPSESPVVLSPPAGPVERELQTRTPLPSPAALPPLPAAPRPPGCQSDAAPLPAPAGLTPPFGCC